MKSFVREIASLEERNKNITFSFLLFVDVFVLSVLFLEQTRLCELVE